MRSISVFIRDSVNLHGLSTTAVFFCPWTYTSAMRYSLIPSHIRHALTWRHKVHAWQKRCRQRPDRSSSLARLCFPNLRDSAFGETGFNRLCLAAVSVGERWQRNRSDEGAALFYHCYVLQVTSSAHHPEETDDLHLVISDDESFDTSLHW